MRTRVLIVSVMAVIVIGLFAVPEVAAQTDLDKHIVLFEDRAIPSGFAAEVEALGGNVLFTHKIGIAIVEGLTNDGADAIGASAMVSDIKRNEVFYLDQTFGSVEAVGSSVPQAPDDPTTATRYPRQWNMRAIDADDAWAEGRFGSPSVTLAILDTGIAYTYPDLDGLVDLSRSVSFLPADDALVDLIFPGMHYVTDLHWHGTHVASTAVSNSYATAGVTTQTTLIGVKVCSVYGGCPTDAIVQGLLWAVDHDADVANMSLGGGFFKAGSEGWVGFYNRLFNYARSEGMTVVVSAGNDGLDLDHFPNLYKTYCSTPSTICVSATAPTAGDSVDGPWTDVDAPTSYTNYGRSAINVAAPGGASISNSAGWVWAGCSTTSLVVPPCQTGWYIIGASGTSMAAPHVSGLASLVVEDVGRRPGQVKTKIQQTADDLGKKGTDPFYGKGRINVGTYATD